MIKITTYLLTLKIVSSREDGSSYRQYLCYVSIYENSFEQTPRDQCLARQSAFSLWSSVMHRLSFRLSKKVSSEVWQTIHSDDVGIGRQHAH